MSAIDGSGAEEDADAGGSSLPPPPQPESASASTDAKAKIAKDFLCLFIVSMMSLIVLGIVQADGSHRGFSCALQCCNARELFIVVLPRAAVNPSPHSYFP